MARLLSSEKDPHGHDLGSILEAIRVEVLKGSDRMTHDGRPETRHFLGHVLDSNSKVLAMLNEARNVFDTMMCLPVQKQQVAVRHSDPLGPVSSR